MVNEAESAAAESREKKPAFERRLRERVGLVLVFTGDGKGKTTAALGTLIRAWGRGLRVCMLQFIKATTSNYGEHRAARKMGIEVVPLGDGFTWRSEDQEKDKAYARQCWEICKEKINSRAYDVIALDEITYPLNYGWLSLEEVKEVLGHRPEGLHVILTGRDASQDLLDFADLVTEMREIKHPYRNGIKGQPGLEF
ncbi:MAG: cob(I)yrinic acid a,c-diamide adenosyltransferase [Chloroflexi bacterium]|nr:cob(I)yrinic acid a,c-diamide adenosyltransferase [Chloroflexota bacterium]